MLSSRGNEKLAYTALLAVWGCLLLYYGPLLLIALGPISSEAAGGVTMGVSVLLFAGAWIVGIPVVVLALFTSLESVIKGSYAQTRRVLLWYATGSVFWIVAAHINERLATLLGLLGFAVCLGLICYWFTHPVTEEANQEHEEGKPTP